MTRVLAITAILAAFTATMVVSAPNDASAKPPSKPIVVVFDTEHGEGADKALAASATRAVCAYLRDTHRVEAVVFNRESPTVLRAIMDKQLTADQVASYSSQEQRVAVAKALAYDYAAGAEVSIKDNLVHLKLWVAKADGGKKERWEAGAQAAVGTTGANNYDNAMQSAASASVISVSRQAFTSLPVVSDGAALTGTETTAITADLAAAPAAPGAAEYAAQAEASLKAGNTANAIQQYQLAVNAEPTNATLRMLLVDAYARKKMYNEAHAELSRAELMGASSDQVEPKRKMIDSLQSGRTASRLDPHPAGTQAQNVGPATSADTPSAGAQAATATGSAKTAVAQMLAGDKLWRGNKPDEAAEAYREAIKLNPQDWRAYERLALVSASVSMFTESRMAIEQLAKVQPNPSAEILAKRYSLFSTIFSQWFAALFKQYDDDSADFAKKIISRESYYSSIKGLNKRLEAMAKFLDVLPVPADKKEAALHRSLACGLLYQGVSSLQDYLETNGKDAKTSAETFVAQAKKELETVKALEANRLVAEKQPPASAPHSSANRTDSAPLAPDQPAAADSDPGSADVDQRNYDQDSEPEPPPTYEPGPPGMTLQERPAPPTEPPVGVEIQQGPAPPAPLPPGIGIQQPPMPDGPPDGGEPDRM